MWFVFTDFIILLQDDRAVGLIWSLLPASAVVRCGTGQTETFWQVYQQGTFQLLGSSLAKIIVYLNTVEAS
jgi:hypothetical protein